MRSNKFWVEDLQSITITGQYNWYHQIKVYVVLLLGVSDDNEFFQNGWPTKGVFKSTQETLEKVWNTFKVNLKKKTPKRPPWPYFTPFCSVSIVEFEKINARWSTN